MDNHFSNSNSCYWTFPDMFLHDTEDRCKDVWFNVSCNVCNNLRVRHYICIAVLICHFPLQYRWNLSNTDSICKQCKPLSAGSFWSPLIWAYHFEKHTHPSILCSRTVWVNCVRACGCYKLLPHGVCSPAAVFPACPLPSWRRHFLSSLHLLPHLPWAVYSWPCPTHWLTDLSGTCMSKMSKLGQV